MKKALSLILATIMLVSLVACGSKNTANNNSTSEKNNTANTEKKEEKAPENVKVETAEKTDDAKYADEITICLTLGTLDPGEGWNGMREGYQRLVFDTLLFHDDTTGEITMQLAESVEWTDDTCTRLHVVLRDGIVFSNGDPLTSEDCAFSFDRSTYSVLKDFYTDCEIVSDTEFYINLSKPCADFKTQLSRAYCAIVNKAETEKNADGVALIGSGPFAYDMDTLVAGNSLTLRRNEKFWGEATPTQTINIVTIADASAAAIALQNGEINLAFQMNATELPQLEANEGLKVATYNSFNFIYLAFNDHRDSNNLTEEEKNFRRAVACAINKDDIVAAVGGGSVMTSLWHYDHPAYISSESEYDHDLSYNPEMAKEYLAKAGGKTEFTCLVDTSRSWCKIAAQIVQEYLRQVGITMNIEETDSTGFSAMTKWDVLECEANLWSNMFLDVLDNWSYYSAGNSNRAQMIDPEIIDALNASAAAASDDERNELYRTVQKELHNNVSWVPLIFRQMNFVYTDGLENFELTASPTYVLRDIALRTN